MQKTKYLAENIHMRSLSFFLILFVLIFSSACFSQIPPPPPVQDSIESNGLRFDRVEIEASYPGKTKDWLQFLMKNLNGSIATENGVPIRKYTTLTQFIVDKD